MDTTCSPCSDFYRFANGAWLDTAKIPTGLSEWGPLPELRRRNQGFIGDMLDSLAFAATRHIRSETERKVGRFYRICMDSSSSGPGALATMATELDRIDAVSSPGQLGEVVGRLQRHRVRALLNVASGYDAEERVGVVAYAFFNAFSLQYLGQYLGTDSTSARARAAFVVAVARAFESVGDAPETASASALRVLAFETALWTTRAGLVDSGITWLPSTVVRAEGPVFGWDGFMRGLGKADITSVGVRPRGMIRAIDSLATSLPLDDWKAYLKWRLVSSLSAVLDAAQDSPRVEQMSSGDPVALARRRCQQLTTQLLADGVAAAYIARRFSPAARAAAVDMVEGLKGLLRERISDLPWLTPGSRAKSIAKLDAMNL